MTDWRRAPGRPLTALEAYLAGLSARDRGELVDPDEPVCGYCTDPEAGRACGRDAVYRLWLAGRRGRKFACAEHAAEARGWPDLDRIEKL